MLGPAAVPTFNPKKDKELAKVWGNLSEYGEAVSVVMTSQPRTVVVVPRGTLTTDGVSGRLFDNLSQVVCRTNSVLAQY